MHIYLQVLEKNLKKVTPYINEVIVRYHPSFCTTKLQHVMTDDPDNTLKSSFD